MNIVIADLNNRGIYRPVDEIYGKYKTNDTGLCNRLLYWELCKIINYLNDDKFNVVIDDEQNPETKNCFDLPNTIVTNARNIDFDNYLPITNKMVDDIINNGYKLEDGNYYTDFTYRQIRDINIEFKKRFIRDLKFKIKEINENINQIVRGCIGIHLRRGRGVKINKGTTIDLSLFEGWDHEILSEYIQMKIKDMPAWQFYQWEYTKDDVYFKIIDISEHSPLPCNIGVSVPYHTHYSKFVYLKAPLFKLHPVPLLTMDASHCIKSHLYPDFT